MRYILSIDQGTTSSRAIAFDHNLTPQNQSQQEFTQFFPNPGWVEHDPKEIIDSVIQTSREVIEQVGIQNIDAVGITNQRETTVIWHRDTGEPIHNAIVWQDRRTAAFCAELKQAGHEEMISAHTGLLLDPYFSATKIKWLLDHTPGARALAEAGKLAFGTIDSWLIWQLSDGKAHITDATNAARSMLYDIRNGCWDSEICALLDIPMSLLPKVQDCASHFADTAPHIFGKSLPILGVAGDQQAATIGQACFEPGMMKSTYGTGCFALLNTGEQLVRSQNRLLSTIAYQLDGKPTYALEGSIFIAGAAVQWLRDGLKIIETAEQSGQMASQADPDQDVYLVPAFTGLGAPYWDAQSKGAIFGLTRNSGPNEIARAALLAVAYQTHDLLNAMRADWPDLSASCTLRVDGGMCGSDYTMQNLANITGARVQRPKVLESTALGVAWLAGYHAGILPDQTTFANNWAAQTSFEPQMEEPQRQEKISGWQDAIQRTLSRA